MPETESAHGDEAERREQPSTRDERAGGEEESDRDEHRPPERDRGQQEADEAPRPETRGEERRADPEQAEAEQENGRRAQRGGRISAGRRYDRAVRELEIDGRRIADDTDCFVIAEIGHNHQGSVEKAQELFVLAKQAGVDAVKLQKRDNRSLFTRELFDSPYDNENSFGPTYGAHREALELDRGAYAELQACARELGLVFFATAFDEASADLLEELDVPAYKIASGDLRNTPLLRHVASFGKPLLVSTGGATLEDVDRAVDAVTAVNPRLCLLQCTASYPAAVEELELGVITTYRERYPELVVGLSDHQDGIAMAPVAYMLGARVIEKHFTASHTAKGTDHAFSLMPEGMRKLVRDLRRVPIAIGDGVKRPLPSESKPLEKMGKKLVATRALPAGHVLAEGDLVAKSPADGGLPPYRLDELLGRPLARALAQEETIQVEDVGSDAPGAVAEGSRAAAAS